MVGPALDIWGIRKEREEGEREEREEREKRTHPSRSWKPFLPFSHEAAGKLYLHPADLRVAAAPAGMQESGLRRYPLLRATRSGLV